jgi:hypothetical protein
MGKQRLAFGKLEGKPIRVVSAGIKIIENRLSHVFFHDETGKMFPQNRAMVDRLEDALKENRMIEGAEASFYMHEICEAFQMRSQSYNE